MAEYREVTSAQGTFSIYVDLPAQRPAPAVIVLQEIFGINQDVRASCRELAEQGFVAVAPDLFWREAPGLDLNAWSEEEWAKGLSLYENYDFAQGVEDIACVAAAIRAMPEANGRIGVMGYCLGGLMTYLSMARLPLHAGVEYYGASTEQYLGEATAITSPMLIHLAGADEFMPPAAQAKIKACFADREDVTVHTYDGCNHAFARHSGSHYDADAVALANRRTYAFLREHLGADRATHVP